MGGYEYVTLRLHVARQADTPGREGGPGIEEGRFVKQVGPVEQFAPLGTDRWQGVAAGSLRH